MTAPRRPADAWAGFHTIRPGRIHLYCPNCKRKMSNMRRAEWDPPKAEVVKTLCPKCCDLLAAKDPPCNYLDARGRYVEEP